MKQKLLTLLAVLLTAVGVSAENYILYTSSNGRIVKPCRTNAFGANIVSNTYENGQGKLLFDGEVTEIGYAAFYECTNLTSVVIPNSVTSIDMDAFSWCSNLASFTGKFASEDHRCLIVDGVLKSCASAGLTFYEIPNSVSRIGEAAFWKCTSLTSVVIPNSVTSIAMDAFLLCTGLTSVEIGNSVKTIGDFAFSDCRSLKSVLIPNSVTTIGVGAFSWNTSLVSVEIPNSVTKIGTSAFCGCTSLTSVEIPNSVKEIGNYTFNSCTSLTSVVIPNSVTTIGEGAFQSCTNLTSIVIPNSVTTIGDDVFDGCNSLTTPLYNNTIFALLPSNYEGAYQIPEGIITIAGTAFLNCYGLTSVELPNSVTEIGNGAFEGCHALTSVELPNSVTSIGVLAFYECTSLKSVEIPNSVKTIGRGAFSMCTNLESFTGKFASEDHRCLIMDDVLKLFAPAGLTSYVIPNSVKKIEDEAFYFCSSLTSVVIPNSVMEIGQRAFCGCGLTSVVIPDSVTEIGNGAFGYCTSLTSVVIPNSVITIGENAFDNCSSLTSIVIPSSVTDIAEYTFHICPNLLEITSLNTTPPSIHGEYCFYAVPVSDCVLRVPAESVEAYKAAEGWKDFVNIKGIITNTEDDLVYETSSDMTVAVIDDGETDLAGEVVIPETLTIDGSTYAVTKIGDGAFEDNTVVTAVTLPPTITEIGDNAFAGCTGLEEIVCLSSIPPTVYANTFAGINKSNAATRAASGAVCVLFVPMESVELYKAAEGWRDFSVIVGIDVTPVKAVSEGHAEGKAYNLSGQPVNNGFRGIIVRDGKKYLKK